LPEKSHADGLKPRREPSIGHKWSADAYIDSDIRIIGLVRRVSDTVGVVQGELERVESKDFKNENGNRQLSAPVSRIEGQLIFLLP
jgi:hypothetical protein